MCDETNKMDRLYDHLKPLLEDFEASVTATYGASFEGPPSLGPPYAGRWPYCVRYLAYPKVHVADHIERPMLSFYLSEIPGSPGWLLSHDVHIEYPLAGKGLGRKLLNIRMAAARAAGFTGIMACVALYNTAEEHLLASSQWTRVGLLDPHLQVWRCLF